MTDTRPPKLAIETEIGANPILASALNTSLSDPSDALSRELAQREARDRWDWALSALIVIGFAILTYKVYHLSAFNPPGPGRR